jgi:predicted Ser/Thr protein kinase
LPENGNSTPKRIGQLAVERGLMTAEQLAEALAEHEKRLGVGSQVPFGELLVELEYIGRKQLDVLLHAQGGKRAPGQQIPGFEVIKKLGEGGMGTTYLARQISMKRLVAIKVLRREMSRNADYVERFRREARLAGELSHPNIAQAMDVGEVGGLHYMVMEYVEGRSLGSLIPVDRGIDEKQALRIVLQAARALAAGNEHGIVHRDIKPDNLLITAKGAVKLCDFGLAKQTGRDTRMLTQTGIALGTPHYVSPEQAQGDRDMDIRGDIYSLGATLYHLVVGRTPYDGPSPAAVAIKHITDPVPSARRDNPRVSGNVDRLISRMMAKDPAHRYQTPAELIAEVEQILAGREVGIKVLPADSGAAGGPAAAPPTEPAPMRRPSGRAVPAGPGTVPMRGLSWPALIRPTLTILAGLGLLTALGLVGWDLLLGRGDAAKLNAELERGMSEVQTLRREHPEDLDEATRMLEALLKRAAGSQWEAPVRTELDAVESARRAAQRRRLAAQARGLAAGGDYDRALELLSAAGTAPGAEDLVRAAAEIRAEAEARIGAVLKAAETEAAAGRPERGLAELDKIAAIKYAPGQTRVAALRAKLLNERRPAPEPPR